MDDKILIKVHENYRRVVAICDPELLGKKFVEGKVQLDLNDHFYNGEEMKIEQAENLIKNLEKDSPSYNIVGEKSINLCIKNKIIDEEGVKKISGIPHAMVF